MRRGTCGGCGSDDLRDVLDLGASALADDFPTTRGAALTQKRHPLGLLRCDACTLLQISELVSDEELWGGEYGFYTGSSWVAAEHQRRYADALLAQFPLLAKRLTVEIACNDGTMLRHFAAAGCPSLGVDPAGGPVEAARKAGLDVIHDGFGRETAGRIVDQRGHAGLVVANNVAAHVVDLEDFLAGVKILLAPMTGVAVLEFQYVVDLLLGNQFDHVYHEHRQFFSLRSFDAALRVHGLRATSVSQVKPQGGSLRVEVRHGVHHADHSVNNLLRDEEWLNRTDSMSGLQGRANRIRQRLLTALRELEGDGKRVAGYGASAKSTTLLNWCDIDDKLIQYMVDTTPTKHGRYTPGTGIPIIDPSADSRAPDVYVMFIHNYLSEVMRREQSFTGRWLVPVPAPVML